MMKKILITGAHFTPAQAVIEELKKEPQTEIVYIGRKSTREGDRTSSVESQVLPSLGVKFIPIIAGRLQRSFTIHTIPSLLKIPVGFVQSFFFLLKEKPDVVLSFGGYVAVPVVVSSWLLSIPVIIHEQTLIPGLANNVSSWFADKIAVSFPKSGFNGKKVVLTGNPIRKEMISENQKLVNTDIKEIISFAKKQRLPIITVVGGNQGSHVINKSVEDALKELTEIGCVVHQTGDSKFGDFERLEEKRKLLSNTKHYLARKWINASEMGWLFDNSTLVVCRAGMNTLLESCYFEKPLLIIPLPVKEQKLNAKYFQKIGNAMVLWQENLDETNLLENIKEMLAKIEGLREGAKKAKEIVIPDAAKRVALETLLLAEK